MTDQLAPPRRTRLVRDERRASILAAATKIFCERPLAEVSMAEIADAAGVARGLLHHHFGGKRDLYLAVVREATRMPAPELPPGAADLPPDALWELAVDAWMTMMASNRERWLTVLAAGGTGHDPEVEAILDEARELVAIRALGVVGMQPDQVTPEVLALTRGYGGFAEEMIREWLLRGRLTREQAKAALLRVLPVLVAEVLPEVVGQPTGRYSAASQ